ncbi:hypothetical protein [Desulfosarcina sp.]|uniref:hypothetical protein n=1 Tax=Desulfosarcina sp. TaxID=2027861 RepID=UPI003970C5C1
MQDNPSKNGFGLQKRSAATNERLLKALMERDRFLDRYPRMRTYQAEIDSLLDKSGNCQGRMAVLGTLMQGKLMEMQKELDQLAYILKQTAHSK